MELDKDKLDFAYKYPFSAEAREVIAASDAALDEKYIRAGKLRVEEDLNSGEHEFHKTSITDIKKSMVISYVYSRMIISAVNNVHIDKYVRSEAARSRSALNTESMPNLMRLLTELGMEMSYSDERFIIKVSSFLMLSSRYRELSLSKQDLEKGLVYLSKEDALLLVSSAIAAEIKKKLPILASDLPKRIIEEAKTVRLPKLKLNVEVREGAYRWIEKVLSNPIADVRHRTVNLILAPYLTTIKGMSEADAAAIILDYIEKCKQLNPDTKVNSTYIKYQCKYAKEKGLKPLSLEKARDLYSGILDLG